MTMTCERFDTVLSAWFEGDLNEADRKAVDAHLRECLRCASIVRDIEAIRHDAALLPELTPSRDLWPGIAERIETPMIELPPPPRQAVSPRRRPWMVAAAVVLMAASSGVTYLVTSKQQTGSSRQQAIGDQQASSERRTAGSVPAVVNGQPRVVTPTRPSSGSGSTVLISAEPTAPAITYDQEITKLRMILDQRRVDLDTATVAAVEKSLRTIDQAIAEASAALAADAASAFLNEQLNRALEKKLGLLRRVALLPVGAS